MRNLNKHLYFLKAPLVQKQPLFGTLLDKVFDYFMAKIVSDAEVDTMEKILASPILKFELQFFLSMEKLLSRVMQFECLDKVDFRHQLGKVHAWHHERWLSI